MFLGLGDPVFGRPRGLAAGRPHPTPEGVWGQSLVGEGRLKVCKRKVRARALHCRVRSPIRRILEAMEVTSVNHILLWPAVAGGVGVSVLVLGVIVLIKRWRIRTRQARLLRRLR